MNQRMLACGLLVLAAACAGENSPPTASDPSLSAGSIGSKSYIVVFKNNIVGAQAVTDQLVATAGTKADFVYSSSIRGFAARMTDHAVAQLRQDPRVAYIELDRPVHITGTQSPTPSWGLDRIDQNSRPLNNSYTYPNDGAGVHFYGIDTGILPTHKEFTGRMGNGISEIPGSPSTVDCAGHGTHTASNAGGTTYGVAKKVTLHAVRVLDCGGSGQFSWVIAGIDWVTANHISPAVANMSLGGGFDQATNDAVTASIASGVTYAIASGNSNANACSFSPASTPNAITVNASDINDVRASFSNFGNCTDIYGPGVNIKAAWIGTDTSTNTISGTSMATPHVAGAAALYLAANPTATPLQVRNALVMNASHNKITNPGTGSPNELVYVGFIGGGGGNQPPVANFTFSCTAGHHCSFDGTSSTDDGSIVSYRWSKEARVVSTAASFSNTFAKAMTVQLTLTVTDNLGATNSITKTVVIP